MLIEQLETLFDRGMATIDKQSNYALLKRKFKRTLGYPLDLENPKTFNEKLQWRKLNVRNPNYVRALDKLAMPDYVRELIGAEHCEGIFTEIYAQTDDPKTLDFKAFPAAFMLKPTHGSGWIKPVFQDSPRDENALRKTCKHWLARRFGYRNHEWGYLAIKPRIMVEEMLLTKQGHLAYDVKIHILNGEFKHAGCIIDRFGQNIITHVTKDWKTVNPLHDYDPGKDPAFGWERMKDIALRIGRNFDYVRVDFLFTDDRFALNELTFYPASGFNPFYTDPTTNRAFDTQLGKNWEPTIDGLPSSTNAK